MIFDIDFIYFNFFLFSKDPHPGMSLETLPDLQWLEDVIFNIDPNNECGLFQPPALLENTMHKSINPM